MVTFNGTSETHLSRVPGTKRPAFIVGPSRSGSTLLAKMLDSHPDVAMLPETWCYQHLDHLGCSEEVTDEWQYILFINSVWQSVYEQDVAASQVIAVHAAQNPRYVGRTLPILEGLASAYLDKHRVRIWGEKTPAHLLFLGRMQKFFPDASVLVIVRDPRDILVSYDDRWGEKGRDTAFLLESAATVRHYLDQLQRNPFPTSQVHQVKYEDLTSNSELTLKDVCRFLEIEFNSSMMEFYRRVGKGEQLRHHKLLSQPVTPDRVGIYREVFAGSQLFLIEEFLAVPMNSLGYSRKTQAPLVLNAQEKHLEAKALKLYAKMESGQIRQRARQKAQLRMLAYKWASLPLSLLGKRMATSREQWLERAESATRASN